MEDKNTHREYVEAVPGPAFMILREDLKKMQESRTKSRKTKKVSGNKRWNKLAKRWRIN